MQFELHVFTSNTGVDVRIFVPKNYRLETLHSRYLRLTKNGAEPSTNQQGNLLFKVQKDRPATPLDLADATLGLGDKFVRTVGVPIQVRGGTHAVLPRERTEEITLIYYPYAIYVYAGRRSDGLYPMTILQSDNGKGNRFRYEANLTDSETMKQDRQILTISESLRRGHTTSITSSVFSAVQQTRIDEATAKIQELEAVIEQASVNLNQARIFF